MYIAYDYRACISDQPMGSKNGGCTHVFFIMDQPISDQT
jgi:hypothetical protein